MTSQAPESEARPDAPEGYPSGTSDSGNTSLFSDIATLIEDGRTYAEAEVAFQKTRAALAGEKAKAGALFGLVALVLLVMAVIALVLGVLIGLMPILTPWGATAVTVIGTLMAAALLGLLAKRKFKAAMAVFSAPAVGDPSSSQAEADEA